MYILEMTKMIKIKILLFHMLLLTGCITYISEQEYVFSAIRKTLLESEILKEDKITELEYASELSISSCFSYSFMKDYKFRIALKSDVLVNYNLFIDAFFKKYSGEYYEFRANGISTTNKDEELAIHIFQLTKSIYIGYIREFRKKLTSRDYQFFALVKDSKVEYSKVFRTAGSWYFKSKHN